MKREGQKESWRKLTFKEWVEGKGMILGQQGGQEGTGEGGGGEGE